MLCRRGVIFYPCTTSTILIYLEACVLICNLWNGCRDNVLTSLAERESTKAGRSAEFGNRAAALKV